MKEETDEYLRKEFTRLTRLKTEIQSSLKLVNDEIIRRRSEKSLRKVGDIWQNSSGWFAQTEQGVSGPWKTEKAAVYASEGSFSTANKIDMSSGS